jgi:Tol biopolymer transport system component
MSAYHRLPIAMAILLLLVAGCGSTTSPTPVPPTATAVSPTRTAMLPTSTPVPPTPTLTPVPPTATQIPPTETPLPPTRTPSSPGSGPGGLIAFASDEDGDFEIWVMGADGSGRQPLTDHDAADLSPAWSPDGNRIAFVSNRDGNDEIYVMNAGGSGVRRLTQTADASERFPAWSPDGKQISFDSDRGGNWDVYVMASDGSDVRRLTEHPSEDWISSWSPDGQRLVFESKRDGNYEVYVMKADGSDLQRLTRNAVHDGGPKWSPDGSSIAFFSRRDGNLEIYTMDADGGHVARLTDQPAEDSFPSWSPDGARVVFTSGGAGHDAIYVMDADGGNVRPLTDNGAQNWSPAWSAGAPMLAVRALLDDLAAHDQLAGAVLIALDGEPILQEAYGMADRTRGVPNQVDTKFNLGSMDKMFTAIAILQLVEEGRLALEDRVGDHLPDYANEAVARGVTIHQLLTHTAGLGDYSESERYEELHDQIRSVGDYVPLFVDTPLEFAPGERFRYSNSGYIVLGLIIEEVTGQSYYEYVGQRIFELCGMENTAAYELDAGVPNLARGYTRFDVAGNELAEIRDNAFVMPTKGGSAGGGFSTVEDLLRFANALLDHQLLPPASTELLLAGKVRMGERVQYGYGFIDRLVENQRAVGHTGGAPGVCSMFSMYLDLGYTTIVLSNSDQDCVAADKILRSAVLP